jgi:tetratricopeptide (TPR) repeat protein
MQEKKETESRIDKLTNMLAAQPEDCFLLHAMGLEYIKIRDVEQAIASFEKVLDIDENYVGTYYHLGLALANAGKKSKAVFAKGIAVSQSLKDKHAESELRMAYDEIFDEEWED